MVSAPVVADLAHDGRRQVIISSTTGELLILNLRDGTVISRIKLAENVFEADPVTIDLNNDGIDDILLANHDTRLYAVDGRALLPGANHR